MQIVITAGRLRELLHYDPDSGIFTWKEKPYRNIIVGSRAGSLNPSGYVLIGIDGDRYWGHRLAWLYMTGRWPVNQIDHRNRDRADNRWKNLRDVSGAINNQNIVAARAHSRTGLLGVSYFKPRGKYRARISVSGAQRVLGYFDTPETAHAAYVAAKRQLHEGNTL